MVVAAGAGDAAAGAVGIGAIAEGDTFISLGTSSQYFVTRERYEPKPETLIHAFAHALPGRWFEMAAMLNGASVLDWAARFLGADIADLLARVEERFAGPSRVVFLPYLAGERTPHNDPDARAGFFGLDNTTTAEDLAQAVLEGVAFTLIDAQIALHAAGRATVPGRCDRRRGAERLLAEADRERHRRGRASGCRLRQGPGLRCRPAGPAGADRRSAGGRVQQAGDHRDDRARRQGLHAAYGERFRLYQSLYRSLKTSSFSQGGSAPGREDVMLAALAAKLSASVTCASLSAATAGLVEEAMLVEPGHHARQKMCRRRRSCRRLSP